MIKFIRMNNERNSGIDLLRIFLTFLICIIHVLGQGGVLEKSTTYGYIIYWFVRLFSYCAVDGYALISGYVSSGKKRNFSRIIYIWFEVLFYSLVISIVVNFLVLKKPITFEFLVSCFFPILNNKYWYMSAYFPLFLLMPYINFGLEKIEKKDLVKLLITLVAIFSLASIVNDNYFADGFSFLWLTILYIVGYILKEYNPLKKIKTYILVIIYLISVSFAWFFDIFVNVYDEVDYCSPSILLCGIILVTIFSRFNIFNKRISFTSSLCLGIYLLQVNEVIWNNVIDNAFDFIANYNVIFGILIIVLSSFAIFVIGAIIDCLRIQLFKIFKIDSLSKKVANIIEKKINEIVTKLIV